ncbi:hypothetical protein RHGRI_012644 [Rhododendron griersonianum]|uniref:SWIM-type domain-containing protein n=1 Tax=Rhododendron griersonianum TaxID=479676 RepID=A0AAV6KRA1_9ERIC|nr:hypothetical protein RHGRI_012644 [Rhododendron griersonianum]
MSTTGMAWILRAPNGFKPKYSSPEYFTIKLNHDGNLVKEDMLEYYVGGTVNYFDFCDNDRISRTELRAMCKEVGYVEEVSLYYRVCHLDGKWVFNIFQTDSDVTSMVQSLNNDLLELYLVNSHLEGSTKVEHNKYVDVEDGLLDIDITSWEWDCGSFSQDNYTCMDLSTHIPSTRKNPSPTKEPPPINEPQPTSRQNQPPTTGRRRRRHLDHDSNSESDSDFDVFIDSDYDLSEDDDALFDANVDKEIEWTGVRQKRVVRSDILHDCLSETESEEGDSSDGFMSFDSASSDEDGKKKPKFRKYRPVLGKVQPIIEEKMIFKNRAQCVEAIRQHAIVNGKEITFEKNDTDRVRAHCATNCPWKILASSITTDRITLQVKTYNPNHDCGWMWTTEFKGFSGNNQFCVDMNAQTCSCRRWELTGIPCAHALAVFRESKQKVQGIVHDYYQKQAYINTYKHVIYPMNGMDMWEKIDKPPIQPPHYTRKSGRPKKCRRREADEPPAQSEYGTKKMRRYLKKLSCRRCGEEGHNVRTCPSSNKGGGTKKKQCEDGTKEKQCSQVITQPTFSQPSQPTPTITRAPKAPTKRGGAAKRGGVP